MTRSKNQNRNKLLNLLTGNLANAVVHKILEEASEEEPRKKYYDDELLNSIEIAKSYREKINPVNEPLLDKDAAEIKRKIINKATAELKLRITKGYENIKLELIEEAANRILAELKIINPS